jgi:hypothetical protein
MFLSGGLVAEGPPDQPASCGRQNYGQHTEDFGALDVRSRFWFCPQFILHILRIELATALLVTVLGLDRQVRVHSRELLVAGTTEHQAGAEGEEGHFRARM